MLPITLPDQHILGDTKLSARADVNRWLKLLGAVRQQIKHGAALTRAMEEVAGRNGVAYGTLKTKWFGFQSRGVEALINRAKHPGSRVGLPSLFKQWLRTMHELHWRGQTGEEVARKVIAQWRAWRAGDPTKAIPGYDSPPDPMPGTMRPHGWTTGNLNRLSNGKPTKHELDQRRLGTAAARKHLPSIMRTRVGLEFGQLIQIDDQDYDELINIEGVNSKAMRPAGFNAFECLSTSHFSFCMKPLLWDAEDKTRGRLTAEDATWFILTFLTEHGYRADVGTTILGEKGTAVVEPALQEGLATVTGGKLKVMTGGMTSNPLMKDMGFPVTSTKHGTRMMAGQSKGNFRVKSDIEGSFALVRTLMAHLQGPTGTRFKVLEENYAKEIYNTHLFKWAEKMPPHRAALLIKPFLSWPEFADLAHWIYRQMDERTWHQIEGWERCGFMESRYIPDLANPDHSIPESEILALPDEATRARMLDAMALPNHRLYCRLSPRRVFQSHRHLLTKLDRHLWNVALGGQYACITRVRDNHTIVVKDRAPGGSDFIYLARARTKQGFTVTLPAGTPVRVYANPFSPDEALVCRESDEAIGLITRMLPTMKLDREGALRNHGKVEQFRAELDIETKARAAVTLGAQRAHMIEHNRALIAGEPTTDAERAGAKASQDMLDAESSVDPKPSDPVTVPQEEPIDPMDL